MLRIRSLRRILPLWAVAACSPVLAQPPSVDPATLYTLSTQGSSAQLKAGEKGLFVLSIQAKKGAHVSEEAPLHLTVSGEGVSVPQQELGAKDSVVQQKAGGPHVDPRFEIPVQATRAGAGHVEAKLTFFICTEKLCARQQKTLRTPIEVL